jgi:hypothetical protein
MDFHIDEIVPNSWRAEYRIQISERPTVGDAGISAICILPSAI